jgi:hypothetical protein
MSSLPIQSAPVIRSRASRGQAASTAGDVAPSITVGIGPAQIQIGPFAPDDAVTPSLIVLGIPIGPFAPDEAE